MPVDLALVPERLPALCSNRFQTWQLASPEILEKLLLSVAAVKYVQKIYTPLTAFALRKRSLGKASRAASIHSDVSSASLVTWQLASAKIIEQLLRGVAAAKDLRKLYAPLVAFSTVTPRAAEFSSQYIIIS